MHDADKSGVEPRWGGKRRVLTLRLVELDAIKQIPEGNEKDLKQFTELLHTVAVTLTGANQETELGSGSLYISFQHNFIENLLAKYKHWVCDNSRTKDFTTFREFIDRESEFMTIASETIRVLSGSRKERATLAKEEPDPKEKQMKKCRVCKDIHGLWACENFKKMTVHDRWNIAKEH